MRSQNGCRFSAWLRKTGFLADGALPSGPLHEAMPSFTKAPIRGSKMAGIEEELGKITEEPGVEPRELRKDSVQAELPEDGGASKPSEKLNNTAEALPPVEEPSDVARFELRAPKEKEHELSMAKPAQNSEPEAPKAEVRAPEPSAPEAQPA